MNSDWYTSRYFFILCLALLLLIAVFQKELAELEWISIVLFVSLGLFVVLNIVMLFFDSRFERAKETKDWWVPESGIDSIGALAVISTGYGYQLNFFIIYQSLKVKTNNVY